MMKRLLCKLALLAGISLVSACGFQLRGLTTPLTPLSFSSIAINNGGVLSEPLQDALQRDGRVRLLAAGQPAEVVLTINQAISAKDILTINRGGKVNEYLLTYRVDASVQRKGEAEPLPLTVIVRRELGYSDSEVLGKEQEEAFLLQDMKRDAADQLIRRLSFLPPVKAANASIKP